MELAELRVFLTVASERSFSRAATKLHRTQPAVSSDTASRGTVGERLFDRSSKDGTLKAGRVLRGYAERLQRSRRRRISRSASSATCSVAAY